MKVALITGASGGIGYATCIKFIKNGYFVIAVYNNGESQIQKLRKELDENGFSNFLLPVKCDLNSDAEIKSSFEIIKRNFKFVDVLVNNAGIDVYKLLTETTDDEWETVFNVNVKSAFKFSRFVLDGMIKKQAGNIINISSIWGEKGASMEVAYSASKSALIGFSKALAKEVAPSNIRVNSICPGVIDTKMNSSFSQEEMQDIISSTPLKRIGTPQEVADLIWFLSSDKASFITGQVITIDGGFAL